MEPGHRRFTHSTRQPSPPSAAGAKRAAMRARPPREPVHFLHALHHFRIRRHCHPQGLVELGRLLNCWDHSRRWCRRRRAPQQLSAPSTDPARSPPALLLKLRCPQWRSLACSRAARCACLSPIAAFYNAASSARSPNADQPSTPPAAAAAHPLATISLRRPRGVR